MFKTIDSFVLGHVERFAHFLQCNFGIHPASIAFLFDVAVLLPLHVFMCYIIQSTNASYWESNAIVLLFTCGALVWLKIAFSVWKNLIREQQKRPNFMNSRKVDPIAFFSRMTLFLFGSCVLTFMFLFRELLYGWMLMLYPVVCVLLSLYFSACDPLPPGQSKFKKWIDSLTKKPVPIRMSD